MSPRTITVLKGVVAGGTNLGLGFALGGSLPGGWDTGLALLAGGLGYGASITLWVAGARDLGAARGQLVFSTAPFVGVAVSWIVFADPVRGVELVALGVAALGVSSVVRSGHAHEHEHEPMEHAHWHDHEAHHDHVHEPGQPDEGGHDHGHLHHRLVHAHPHVPDCHHRHH